MKKFYYICLIILFSSISFLFKTILPAILVGGVITVIVQSIFNQNWMMVFIFLSAFFALKIEVTRIMDTQAKKT